jgi:hypothetical protein
MALRRWPSLAAACRAALAANGAVEGRDFSVVLCRQYDELELGVHVGEAVHLLVADLVDDGEEARLLRACGTRMADGAFCHCYVMLLHRACV